MMKRALKAATFDRENVYPAGFLPLGSVSTRGRVTGSLQFVKLKK